jgi:hypothetical protein
MSSYMKVLQTKEKWEYLSRYTDDFEDLQTEISSYGQEGWELVNFLYSNSWYYVMKRKIHNATSN